MTLLKVMRMKWGQREARLQKRATPHFSLQKRGTQIIIVRLEQL